MFDNHKAEWKYNWYNATNVLYEQYCNWLTDWLTDRNNT